MIFFFNPTTFFHFLQSALLLLHIVVLSSFENCGVHLGHPDAVLEVFMSFYKLCVFDRV